MINFDSKIIRSLSLLGFSGTLGLVLDDIAKTNKSVYVLTSDLTFFSGFNRLKDSILNRFINVGIAEQNMVSIAGGLTTEGKKTYMTTYASFMCTRALDQIKTCMSYMQLPMVAIGLTSGYATGILGATHMCIEDIGILKALPNITIVQPADSLELAKILYASEKYNKPMYIRGFGIGRLPMVYKEDYNYEIGKVIKIVDGKDICIFSTGTMVNTALEVSKKLQEHNISTTVINIHTLKPLDEEAIINNSNCKYCFTIEEHNVIGGLGESINSIYIKNKMNVNHTIFAINDCYYHAASLDYLINKSGLNKENIANQILKIIDK